MHVPQKGSLAGARLRDSGNVGPSAAPLAVRFCSAAQVKQAVLEDLYPLWPTPGDLQ